MDKNSIIRARDLRLGCCAESEFSGIQNPGFNPWRQGGDLSKVPRNERKSRYLLLVDDSSESRVISFDHHWVRCNLNFASDGRHAKMQLETGCFRNANFYRCVDDRVEAALCSLQFVTSRGQQNETESSRFIGDSGPCPARTVPGQLKTHSRDHCAGRIQSNTRQGSG